MSEEKMSCTFVKFTLGLGDKLLFDVFEVWHGEGNLSAQLDLERFSRNLELQGSAGDRGTLRLNHSHKSWLTSDPGSSAQAHPRISAHFGRKKELKRALDIGQYSFR